MITTRLWHYALVKYLPRQQLLSQWRECVCIAKSIHDKGTPNNILVNKIMNYPISEFKNYCNIVLAEMVKRGYNVNESSINKLEDYIKFEVDNNKQYSAPFINGWHNLRYLNQCFYNLQEKYDCGGITNKEWGKVCEGCVEIENQRRYES